MNSVLSGFLVLDLAQLITGPWCASLLGDLGAEVIKIEPPRGGEALRGIGPFVEGESVLFLSINRNKRDLTLALNKPEGRRILDRLISRADVLIQNFRPDVRRAYDLDYETLRRTKPDMVCLSITAFGESGPYRLKPGTDHVFQGLSGVTSVSGEQGQGPLRLGVPAADMTAAMYAVTGVLAALLDRQRTGQGQEVTINLLDAAMSFQQTTLGQFLLTNRPPPRTGNSSPFASPVSIFATADGYLSLSAFNDKFWLALLAAVGREDLADDPRFEGNENRMAHRRELESILAGCFVDRTTAGWLEVLEAADVPCGPVHDYSTLFEDPQVIENDLTAWLPHAGLDRVPVLKSPISLSRSTIRYGAAAPLLGQHTEELLAEYGLSTDEIQQLRQRRIV
jgi:crotonobetainyl-CoA:carnitine CoA-transferase CaiB-like acyl-CoA transferase